MAFIENGSNYLALLNLTTVTADEIISPYLTVDVLTVETELITPSINFSGTGFFVTPIRQSLTGPNFLTYNTITNEITYDTTFPGGGGGSTGCSLGMNSHKILKNMY